MPQAENSLTFQDFGGQLNRYITDLGLCAPKVVKRQSQLLNKTLIDLTFPQTEGTLKRKIAEEVPAKFALLRDNHKHSFDDYKAGGKAGRGYDTRWYGFTPFGIYGVSRDLDLTRADADQLYFVHWKYQLQKSSNRISVGQRGKQKVYLFKKVLTKESEVKKLVRRLQRHVGRLKAGWLPANQDLECSFSVPHWVTAHGTAARGKVENKLDDKEKPSYGQCNYALGARALQERLNTAMTARANAMAKDLAFAARNPEKWKQREADAGWNW